MTRVRYVNFARAAQVHRAEIDAAFARVLESGTYIAGPEVDAFEREFAAYCGTAHAIGVANGTDALELTLRAWGIGAGDEVIVPANTAVQTALAVTHAGARVVPVDVEDDTGSIDVAACAAAIGPATRAVIPVDLYGHPADVDALRALLPAGVRVLEDAAHAHGARSRERRCGALGDAAAFSFYPTKNLGAFGDAGCMTTDDAVLAARVHGLRTASPPPNGDFAVHARTSRLDPLQAAQLRWKLRHLDAWNARRRELAALYAAELDGVAGVTLPVVRPGAEPVWHAYAVRVRDGARDAVRAALADAGIDTNVHYPVPVHRQTCYATDAPPPSLPVSEARARELLSLPLDPFHTDDEIRRVAAELRRAIARTHGSRAVAHA